MTVNDADVIQFGIDRELDCVFCKDFKIMYPPEEAPVCATRQTESACINQVADTLWGQIRDL